MKLPYRRRDVLQGIVVYTAGDTAAALVLGEASWMRALVVALVGGFVYALEVPAYFRWIDRRVSGKRGWRLGMTRTALALAYFNPLWIARHLFFLRAAVADWDAITFDLLRIGAESWVLNIPIAFLGNWVIQTRLPLRWRFFGSAIFSGLMAIYYAVSGSLLR